MFGGPNVSNTIPEGLEDEQRGVGGFLSSLLSQPQALKSFLGGQKDQFTGAAGDFLMSILGGGGQDAAQGVVDASIPGFERNLATAQGQLGASASSPFSTAFGLQEVDLASRAVSDFNLFQAQQFQQAQQTGVNAAQILGALGGQEGQQNLQALDIVSRFFSPQAAAGPNAFQQSTGFLDVIF